MKIFKAQSKDIALAAILSALGVVIAHTLWFPWLGTKAYPGQHIINSIAGILLGPIWAAIIAVIVGTIRIALGIGTIYAYPGGIPGGIIVGLIYWLFRKITSRKMALIAALSEPIGTVLIGGTLSLFIVAPLAGTEALLSSLKAKGAIGALIGLWSGWALSSVPGCIIGYLVLMSLEGAGILAQLESS